VRQQWQLRFATVCANECDVVRITRVQETEMLTKDPVPGISAAPFEDNLRYFNVVLEGPPETPYAGAQRGNRQESLSSHAKKQQRTLFAGLRSSDTLQVASSSWSSTCPMITQCAHRCVDGCVSSSRNSLRDPHRGYADLPPAAHAKTALQKVRYLTKIYHPNVDKLGRICLDILKDK
jgi:hypothetical protein